MMQTAAQKLRMEGRDRALGKEGKERLRNWRKKARETEARDWVRKTSSGR